MSDGNNQPVEKICPYLNGPCIQNKCVHWMQIQVGQVGRLGMPVSTPMNMCIFHALLLALMGSQKPQQIPIPPFKGQ